MAKRDPLGLARGVADLWSPVRARSMRELQKLYKHMAFRPVPWGHSMEVNDTSDRSDRCTRPIEQM